VGSYVEILNISLVRFGAICNYLVYEIYVRYIVVLYGSIIMLRLCGVYGMYLGICPLKLFI
jgi:hypothetical protein